MTRKAKVAATTAEDQGPDAALGCAHCGDALAGLRIVRKRVGGATQLYCCHGCAFIAEQLQLAQAVTRDRAALDASLGAPVAAPLAADGQTVERAVLDVRGMVCAACALLLEHQLRRTAGVLQVHVDFAARRAWVGFDPARVDAAALARVVRRAGYRAVPAGAEAATERRARRIDLLRVLVAWFAMMQVMMLAVPQYLAAPGDVAPDIEQLLRIASLILTLPVVLFSAQPILRAAASQLRMRAIGMDLPVAVGLLAAFGASVVATVQAHGAVYFDSVTMFVALVLGSRWLQARALAAARVHIDAAQAQSTLTAQRLTDWPTALVTERVDAGALAVGDHLLVPPGESVAADGVVVRGRSAVSQAWLTGESTPIGKDEGAAVLAGSIVLEQPLVLEVTRVGEATTLAALRRLVDDAGRERPRIVELANRYAVVFLWAVLGVTAATLAGWWLIDPQQAVRNAIAVLVVTCPCALSLAAPAALAVAQSALARRQVLVGRVAAIEALAAARTLAVDKTGTLTDGAPALTRQLVLRGDSRHALAVAAALEVLSTHPFAQALVAAGRRAGLATLPLAEGRVVASAGVEGVVAGHRWRLGSIEFVVHGEGAPERRAALARLLAREQVGAASAVVLAQEDDPVAIFVFGEVLRPDAPYLVHLLQQAGIELVLLSGDRREPVHAVAATLGIERVYAHQTPQSKKEFVGAEQRAGRVVAMLGDGMNDAPVIAQADASLALASGASLAQARADFVVLTSSLADVAAAFRVARKALRVVRQNLAWALAYNLVMVPAAALGYVSPALAAAGMAASSLLVVANALRVRRAA